MQTYICYKSHAKTARALDSARLGQQRLDTVTILEVILGRTNSYEDHPAVRMWWEYPEALVLYGLIMCHEWRIVRGKTCHVWETLSEMAGALGMTSLDEPVEQPPWMECVDVMRSHRSRLIVKLASKYMPEFGKTPRNMPYLWPQNVREEPCGYRLRLTELDIERLANGERKLPAWLVWDSAKREVLHRDSL